MKTIKLATPIEHGGKRHDALTFRKPKAKDMVVAETVSKNMGQFGQTLAMLASMADVTFQAMQELEIDDVNTIVDQLGDWLGNSQAPAAGATS